MSHSPGYEEGRVQVPLAYSFWAVLGGALGKLSGVPGHPSSHQNIGCIWLVPYLILLKLCINADHVLNHNTITFDWVPTGYPEKVDGC